MKNKTKCLSFFTLIIALTSVQIAKAGIGSGGTSVNMATIATIMMLKAYEPDFQQLQVPDSIKKELPLSLDIFEQPGLNDRTRTTEQYGQPPESGPTASGQKELRTRKIQKKPELASSEPDLPDSIPAFFRQQAGETFWDELTEYASDFGWNAFMALGPTAAGILTDYLMKNPELADKTESLTDWSTDIYDSPSLSVFLQYLVTSYLPKRILSDATGYSFLIFNMSLISQFYSDVITSFSQHQKTFPVLMTEAEMARHFRIQLINRHKLDIEFLDSWDEDTFSASESLVPFIKLHQAARAANVHKITLLTDSSEGRLAAMMQMHQPGQTLAPVMLGGHYGDTGSSIWLNESFYNRQVSRHQELSYTYQLYDWWFGEEQRSMVNPLALPMIDYLTRHLVAFKTSGGNMMPFHNPIFQRVGGNTVSEREHTATAAGIATPSIATPSIATPLFAGEVDLRSVEQHAYELLVGNDIVISGTTPIHSQRFTTAVDNLLIDNFSGSEILYLTPGLNVTEADLQQLDAKRYDSSLGWKYLFHFTGAHSMAQLLQRQFIGHLLRGMTRAYQHSKQAVRLNVAGAGGGDEDCDPEADRNRKRNKKPEKEKPENNPFNKDNNGNIRKAAPMTNENSDSGSSSDSSDANSATGQPATLTPASHSNDAVKKDAGGSGDDPDDEKNHHKKPLPKDQMDDIEIPKKNKRQPIVRSTKKSNERDAHIQKQIDQQPSELSRDELIKAAKLEYTAQKGNKQFPRQTIPKATQSMQDLTVDPVLAYTDQQTRYDHEKDEASSLIEGHYGRAVAWNYASSLKALHGQGINPDQLTSLMIPAEISHSRTSSVASSYSAMSGTSEISMTSVTSATGLQRKMSAARTTGNTTGNNASPMRTANALHRSSGRSQITKGFRTQGELDSYLKKEEENFGKLEQELSQAKAKYNSLGTVTRSSVRKEHKGKLEEAEANIQRHHQELLAKNLDQTSQLTGRVHRLETRDDQFAKKLTTVANEAEKLKQAIAQIPADVISGEMAGQISEVKEALQQLTERVLQDTTDSGQPETSKAPLKNAARQEVAAQLDSLQKHLDRQLELAVQQFRFHFDGRLAEFEEAIPQLREQLEEQASTEFFANAKTQSRLSTLETTAKETTERVYQEVAQQKSSAALAQEQLNKDFQEVIVIVEANMENQGEIQTAVKAALREFYGVAEELQQVNKEHETSLESMATLPARVSDLEEQAKDSRNHGNTMNELKVANELQSKELNGVKVQLESRMEWIETKQNDEITTLKQSTTKSQKQLNAELTRLEARQINLDQLWQQQLNELKQQTEQEKTAQQQSLKETKQQAEELTRELSAEKKTFETRFSWLTESLLKHQQVTQAENVQLLDDVKMIKETLNIDTGASVSTPADAQRLHFIENRQEHQHAMANELNERLNTQSDQLTTIEKKLNERLNTQSDQLTTIEKKLNKRLDTKNDQLITIGKETNERLDKQNNWLSAVEQKLNRVSARQHSKLNTKTHDDYQEKTTAHFNTVDRTQAAHENRITEAETRQEKLSSTLAELSKKHKEHVERYDEFDDWYIQQDKEVREKVTSAHKALTEAAKKSELATKGITEKNTQLSTRLDILELQLKSTTEQLGNEQSQRKQQDAELRQLNSLMNSRLGMTALAIPAASVLTYLASSYTGLYVALHPYEVIHWLKTLLGEERYPEPGRLKL